MKNLFSVTFLLIVIPILTIICLNKFMSFGNTKFILERTTKVRVKRSELGIVESEPLEQYLVGVLAGEMPTSYDIEALKAQAVAARTYTLRKMNTNLNLDYDVVDTTDDQVYLDDDYLRSIWKDSYNSNIEKIRDAVRDTSGEYITYQGEIIKAFFFSTSSGITENCRDVFGEDLPYLVSVSSTWDENSPSYSYLEFFSKDEFYEKLGLDYNDVLDISIVRNDTNSINTITINGSEIKGTDFRFKLGLRSTNVLVEEVDGKVRVSSKGYGHGVGMSQYGALELAKKGYSYRDILKYYYQGTEIEKI